MNKLFQLPQGRSFICPICVGIPFEQMRMYVEIIPSEVADVMREPLKYASEVSRSINDSCGYESLNSAVLDAELIAARLFGEVIPENLLFVFGQTIQSLSHFEIKFPLSPPISYERKCVCKNRHKKKRHCDDEDKSNNRAIILCKLKDAQLFKDFFTAKEQKGSNDAECYEISWSEFQELKERLCKFGEHG